MGQKGRALLYMFYFISLFLYVGKYRGRHPRHLPRQFCLWLCMISPEFSKRRSGEGGE